MEGNAGGVVLRSEFEVAMDSSTSVIFFNSKMSFKRH